MTHTTTHARRATGAGDDTGPVRDTGAVRGPRTVRGARALRGTLLAAAVLLACAAPVQADPDPTAPEPAPTAPDRWLHLTVGPGEAPSAADPGTLLLCDPPRGHRRAADACAELEAADGRIAGIPPKEVMCTMVHAPVTVQARGMWRGRPVAYTETFPNACVMAARTGSVFTADGP
ncbi:SSI family serine proteinase inhibitor [Streptomyces sp. enrichment culture]|uniref:SSI family serine proteinase inhibitor n=1 Tax=Streptomyces sp. enrichment culture TaxID=1795815 RepID=UPI003F546939